MNTRMLGAGLDPALFKFAHYAVLKRGFDQTRAKRIAHVLEVIFRCDGFKLFARAW